MPYPTKAVANQFLKLGKSGGIAITPMKLQKLVFYAHGWHLGIFDKPLVDEQVECWRYGPVFSSLFREFKAFGSDPIQGLAAVFVPDDDTDSFFGLKRVIPEMPPGDSQAIGVIGSVWKNYKNYTAVQLSNMTHLEGTPWKRTLDEWGGNPPRHTDIPQNLIKEYFKNLASEQPA